jgi:hypothetical protein
MYDRSYLDRQRRQMIPYLVFFLAIMFIGGWTPLFNGLLRESKNEAEIKAPSIGTLKTEDPFSQVATKPDVKTKINANLDAGINRHQSTVTVEKVLGGKFIATSENCNLLPFCLNTVIGVYDSVEEAKKDAVKKIREGYNELIQQHTEMVASLPEE